MGTPRSHRAPCAVFLGADPWSRVIGYSFEIRSSWDLGSVGWSDASLNNAAGLTGPVVQLVLDAMPGTG